MGQAMRSIVNPQSVCVNASVIRSSTVAQRVDSTCATTLLVNLRRLIKFRSLKVKRRAFFLSTPSRCGVNNQLNIQAVGDSSFKAQFSAFGGWVQ